MRPTAYSRIREIGAWVAGVMTVHVIWSAIRTEPGFDAYRILFLPFIWFASAGTVVWLLDRALRLEGWQRYFLLGLTLLAPSVLNLVPYFYHSAAVLASWVVSVVIAGTAIFLIFLDSRGRLS